MVIAPEPVQQGVMVKEEGLQTASADEVEVEDLRPVGVAEAVLAEQEEAPSSAAAADDDVFGGDAVAAGAALRGGTAGAVGARAVVFVAGDAMRTRPSALRMLATMHHGFQHTHC